MLQRKQEAVMHQSSPRQSPAPCGAIDAVAASIERLVKTTSEVGGDVGAAVMQATEGTLQQARSAGFNALEAVGAAAGGAVRAAAQRGGGGARVAESGGE